MQVFVRKGITVVALLLVVTVLILALCFAAMRTLAPMGGKYADNIQHQVSKLIGRPVEIGHLIFTIEGVTPTARLSDLVIFSQDGERPDMTFREMDITLDMLSSALKVEWIPKRVVLRGSRIRVDRTLDGRFLVSGFEFGGSGGEDYSLDILNELTFKVQDLDVFWNDMPLGLEYEVKATDMDVYIESERLAINGTVLLPEGIDSEVELAVDVEGPVTEYTKWKGAFYATTQDLNLLGLPFELAGDFPIALQTGEAQIELSGNWEGQKALQAQVEVEASNISIDPNKASAVDQAMQVTDLRSNIEVVLKNRQWQIKTDELILAANDLIWPKTGFNVQFERDKNALRDFTANVDFLDLETLAGVLETMLPEHPQVKLVRQHQPSGSVSNLRFRIAEITPENVANLEVSGDFANLSWLQFGKVPGIDSINASVNFTENGGEATVTGVDVSYNSTAMFDESLRLDELLAQLSWDTSEQEKTTVTVQQLQAGNSEISVEGSTSLIIAADSKPLIDLQLNSPGIDLDLAHKYLPKALKPKVRTWLKNGLLGGRAENAVFALKGPLSKQSLRRGELKLDGSVDAKNIRVHYLDEYPDIENVSGKVHFRDHGVRVDLSDGAVSQSKIRSGYVQIENYFAAVVDLDVNSLGTSVGALEYLKSAKFGQNLVPFLETVDADGLVSLDLKIDVPLGKMRDTIPRIIQGDIGLRGNHLALPDVDIDFTKVTGKLHFNGSNFTASNIKANFRGKPVIGSVVTKADREIHISVSGNMKVIELLPDNRLMAAITEGTSPWHGTVILPSRTDSQNGVARKLVLRSGLIGTTVDLPVPVGKAAAETLPIKIETDLTRGDRILRISYGDDLQAAMEVAERDGSYAILHANVACNNAQPSLKTKGLSLIGECGNLELSKWIPRVRELSSRSDSGSVLQLSAAASFEKILFAGQEFKDADVELANGQQYWDLTVDSEQISGSINLPFDLGEEDKIIADLERLRVTTNEGDGDSLSPKLVLGLDVSVAEFFYNGKNLGGVELQTSRLPQGMLIEEVKLQRKNLTANVNGSWNELDENSSVSQLEFQIDGDNFGSLVSDFGVSRNLISANGTLSADLSWQGAPYRIDFETLSGVLNTTVRDGRLRDVEPGLARVLGLINFDALPKRIALQFSDVGGEGFHFEKMFGRLAIDKGVANMNSLQIESDSANMEIVGDVDTAERTYDLDLEVVPSLTTTVPLATTLIAGPQTGILVYLLDKITQGAGVDFNKTITQNYLIKGAWDAPEIEQVNTQQIDQEEDNLFDGD